MVHCCVRSASGSIAVQTVVQIGRLGGSTVVCTLAQCWVHTFAQCSAMEREAPGSLGRVDWRGQSLKSSKEQLGIVKEKIVTHRDPCRHHTHDNDHVVEERETVKRFTPIIHFM